MQMRRARGNMLANNPGIRGRRGGCAQRSYPSLCSSSPDPTVTTRSREREIQTQKRQIQVVKAELGSLERQTGTLARGSIVTGIKVSADPDRCVGCGICQGVCPAGAISVENVALVDSGRCTGCGLCVEECPMGALSVVPLKYSRGEEACVAS